MARVNVREEIIRYYRLLRRYGYNDSHSGNLSARDGERVWITPTGACADTLHSHDLICCPLPGPPPDGASLDAPLHLAVYAANPAARAVMHSHSPHCVALTLGGADFEPLDFEGRLYFPRVRVIDIDPARYLQESPARVAENLAGDPVTVVRGHGVYACGASLELAYKWTCSFEMSAHTAFIARQAGTG